MKISQIAERIENGKVRKAIEKAFSSIFFPIVTAFVTILCYYLGWDIVTIWYICLCGTAILVCCKDITPLFCPFLFSNIIFSIRNCPSDMGAESDYFIRPAILGQLISLLTIFIITLIVRMALNVKRGNFKPNRIFFGLIALAAVMMLSGSFYSSYTPLNLAFGLLLSIVMVGIFVVFSSNGMPTQKNFKQIAYYLIILFAAITLELTVAYFTIDGLLDGGTINRGKLFMGWGTYNNMGMLLTVTIPAWFYLAIKNKLSFLFFLGGTANLAAAVMSMSRQAILMGAIVYILCTIWLLVARGGRDRIINASLAGGFLLIGIITASVMHEQMGYIFASLVASFSTGSGRIYLWKQGLRDFCNSPLFGVGFYNPKAVHGEAGYFETVIANIIPYMYHDTLVQFLGSCGLIGFFVYVFHRAQTINSFLNNITIERIFIAATMVALLLVSLLDNHLFYFLPTIIYAVMLAMLSVTEKDTSSPKLRVMRKIK